MTIIVALDENNAIGNNNQLLWHLPNDLKRFKLLTQNHAIIMGRKTFESLNNKPLPNRANIVISSNLDYVVPEGVFLVSSLEEAVKLAKKKDDNPFIIGGGNIYKQMINDADVLEITLVHTKIDDADTFFPVIDSSLWVKEKEVFHSKDEKHLYNFTFITYSKKK